MASADVCIYLLKPVFHYEQPGMLLLHRHTAVSLARRHLGSPHSVCHWSDEIYSSYEDVEMCKFGC